MLFNRLAFTFILLIISIFVGDCVDEHFINVIENDLTGSIYIESIPTGAKIFLMDTETKKVTPDSIVNLESGSYNIKLSLEDFQDTTFSIQVYKSQKSTKIISLKPTVFNGKIIVLSNPPGADIFLNDQNTSKITPDSILNLKYGTYFLSLKLKDYLDTTITVNLLKDERVLTNIALREKIPQGKIFINSEPQDAQITLNGIQTNSFTPDTLFNLHGGNYVISLTKPGFIDTTFSLILNEDEFVSKFIVLRKLPSYGNIFISSFPEGSKIFLNGIDIKKVTPDTLKFLTIGPYLVSLTLPDFKDTSFIAYVEENKLNRYDINLVENLPQLEVEITYSVSQSGQLIFTFLFNQAIKLNSINIFLPESNNSLKFDFYNQQYPENYPIELVYPEKVTGTWNFEFYGTKVRGLKNNFVLMQQIEVN